MKVKFEDPSVNFAGIWAGTNSTQTSKYSTGVVANSIFETGNYQIVVFDGTGYDATQAGYSGTWFGLLGRLAADNTTLTAEQGCYVQWVGAFKTVDAAYAYDNDIPTALFYDFSEQENVSNYVNKGVVKTDNNGTGNNITFNYDETNEALKATPVAGATASRFLISAPTGFTADVAEYPVMAIKFKVGNASKNFGGVFPGFNHGVSGQSVYKTRYFGESVTETGDWQVLVYDMSTYTDKTYVKGTYNSFIVAILTNNLTVASGDCLYVQWAGAFKSEEAAYSYDKEVSTPTVYNYTTSDGLSRASKAYALTNVTASYSDEYTALKLTASNTGASCATATDTFLILPVPAFATKSLNPLLICSTSLFH